MLLDNFHCKSKRSYFNPPYINYGKIYFKNQKVRYLFQGSEAAPQPRISLSFKPACEQKKKFQKEGLSAKEQFYTSS